HYRTRRQAHRTHQAATRGIERHHHHVVLVAAEAAHALGLQGAEHGEVGAADPHGLADTGVGTEQLAAHRLAEDHHLVGGMLRFEARAAGDPPAVDLEEVLLDALPAGGPVVLGEDDLAAAAQRGGHQLDLGDLLADRLGVPLGEGVVAAGAHAHAAHAALDLRADV